MRPPAPTAAEAPAARADREMIARGRELEVVSHTSSSLAAGSQVDPPRPP